MPNTFRNHAYAHLSIHIATANVTIIIVSIINIIVLIIFDTTNIIISCCTRMEWAVANSIRRQNRPRHFKLSLLLSAQKDENAQIYFLIEPDVS